AARAGVDFVAVFLEGFFGAVGEGFALVFQVDDLAAFLVLGGVGFGVALHLLDVFLGETAAVLHGDLAFLVAATVFGVNIENAVDVDVEGDLDLRHTARGGGNAFEIESAEQAIVAGEL